MTIKEQPLINAASRMGAIQTPGHPVLAGLFAFFVSGIFGSIATLFLVFGRGVVEALALYGALVGGFVIGSVICAGCLIYLWVMIWVGEGEADTMRPFSVGIALGAALLIVLICLDGPLVAYLAEIGPLQGPPR